MIDIEEYQKEPENPSTKIANRWKKKMIRYGSKDSGVLNDPSDLQAADRGSSGDPYGPSAPIVITGGYQTGGRQPGWNMGMKEQPAEPIPYYEPDDPDVLQKLFGIRS